MEEKLVYYGIKLKAKKMVVDEDLPNFFLSIRMSSAQELVCENENLMNKFGFEITDPDTIKGLSNIMMPFKAMLGSPWY